MAGRIDGAAPIQAGERSALLDSVRGYALLGILIANMVTFIGFAFMEGAEREAALGSAFDDLAEFQIDRLEQRGEGTARYLRRLAVLFLIGLAHIFLLWLGDIVALYALMGALLLLFRRQSDGALIGWAVLLWLVPVAWSALIHFGGVDIARPIYGLGMQTLAAWGIDASTGPFAYYRDTGYVAALASRPGEAFFRLGDLVYQMRFAKVLGMFLVGLWVGRRAIHGNPAAFRPLLRKVARIGFLIGLPLSIARTLVDMAGPDTPAVRFLVESLYCVSTPLLALGYVAVATSWWADGRQKILAWAAPAGRMALTNYLMQTVLQSLIFYGWGLGLIGRFGLVFVFPVSLAIFVLQIFYSRWWLARFRFGPIEWLWRSLTYGRAQPLRRETA
jgi:uncharacterized protein